MKPYLAACCGILLILGSSAIARQDGKPAPAAKPGITAEQVLDRYIEVTGGKAAYARIKSTVMKGNLSLTAQNLKGTVEVRAKAPNKFYTVQTFDQVGAVTVGFDGKTGWSKDRINGLRVLEGKELTQLHEQAVFNSPAHWREIYKKVELIGVRQVEGKDAYAVRLTPHDGPPTIQFHDTRTFLVVRADTVQESQQGSIPVESYVSDYRTVDGVKAAFKIRSRVAASEIVTEVTELKNNVAIPDSVFAKPAK